VRILLQLRGEAPTEININGFEQSFILPVTMFLQEKPAEAIKHKEEKNKKT
jgi:hypothetical protein